MKIILINNHSILNAGDYGILLQSLRLLEMAFPQADIILTFNDVASARVALPTYRIHRSPISWISEQDAQRRPIGVLPILRYVYLLAIVISALLFRWLKRPVRIFVDSQKQALYQDLATADMVVACGGGYLYTNPNQWRPTGWFTFASALCWWSVLLGRPLIMLPQSIGPLYDLFPVQLVRSILRHAKLVWGRESISLRRTYELGITQAQLEPDLALGMESASATLAQALLASYLPAIVDAPMRVGITAIDWQRQNDSFIHQHVYETALVECIDELTGRGAVVVLFAQTCGPTALEDDRLVNRRLYQRVRHPQRVVMINEIIHPALLQALYGCMDYFIATRLHSFIFATNAGVPAIVIGYLSKSAGLLADMGALNRHIDIRQLTGASLIAAFDALQHDDCQHQLDTYVQNARQRHNAMIQTLRRIAGSLTTVSNDELTSWKI